MHHNTFAPECPTVTWQHGQTIVRAGRGWLRLAKQQTDFTVSVRDGLPSLRAALGDFVATTARQPDTPYREDHVIEGVEFNLTHDHLIAVPALVLWVGSAPFTLSHELVADLQAWFAGELTLRLSAGSEHIIVAGRGDRGRQVALNLESYAVARLCQLLLRCANDTEERRTDTELGRVQINRTGHRLCLLNHGPHRLLLRCAERGGEGTFSMCRSELATLAVALHNLQGDRP